MALSELGLLPNSDYWQLLGRVWEARKEPRKRIRQGRRKAGIGSPGCQEGQAMKGDKISIVWSVVDVKSVRPDLDRKQCREVLADVLSGHEASIGVCWDVLETVAEMGFPSDADLQRKIEGFKEWCDELEGGDILWDGRFSHADRLWKRFQKVREEQEASAKEEDQRIAEPLEKSLDKPATAGLDEVIAEANSPKAVDTAENDQKAWEKQQAYKDELADELLRQAREGTPDEILKAAYDYERECSA